MKEEIMFDWLTTDNEPKWSDSLTEKQINAIESLDIYPDTPPLMALVKIAECLQHKAGAGKLDSKIDLLYEQIKELKETTVKKEDIDI
jgi:hypothetical protein